MFQCKTRGNSSPQGKRRVYFSCHPEDFEKLFERISSELLKITDCAIYYSSDDEYEDIDIDLGQMNLFVVPITTKLLTKTCRAIQLDVPFALNKHIPILPLMQEGGLDELFSRYFGDLQYLDPNARDESAISYDEKLKKYLNSVLIGDELAEKVRAAFDTYIFMSYRKKDRKYANELMRLIHKNDFCRDIAIWYDEYLVPGENFNQAITDALNKSELFTLVVTPNLVNEINYVQTVEYPEAAKQNKIIIPAELEKTDQNKLEELYPGIPNSFDARNNTALSKSLKDALLQIAHRENDNDPQHNFFIGLAYLDGIDVEVNHERALELIRSAAEAKENVVPEAIEKLVVMYKEGYGVERNYRTATEWQSKLVEYWEEKYQITKDKYDYKKMFNSLKELISQFYDLGELDSAEKSSVRLINFCKLRGQESEDDETRHNLWDSYITLGDICLSQNKYKKAKRNYLKSFKLIIHNNKNNRLTICAKRDLANTYYSLGNWYLKVYDNKIKAEDFYKKAHTIKTEITMTAIGTDDDWRDLMFFRLHLGDFYLMKKDFHEAECYYDFANSVLGSIVVNNHSIENKKALTFSFNKLAEKCLKEYRWDEAEIYYQKCISLHEQIAAESETMENKQFLAEGYIKVGEYYEARNETDRAGDFYQKALSYCEQLANENETITVRRDLSICYNKLGHLNEEQCNLNNAEMFYNKDFELNKLFVKENGFFRDRIGFLICYHNLGSIYIKKNNMNKAEELFQKGLVLSKQLAKETNDIEAYSNLARFYFDLAIMRKPYNLQLLKEALHVYTYLTKQNLPDKEYYEKRNEIKNYFNKLRRKRVELIVKHKICSPLVE